MKKMFWIFCFAFIALETTYTFANECNSSHVEPCFDDLVIYEDLAFPLYGANEDELNETCRNINESFECLEVFGDLCQGKPECNEECKETINDVTNLLQNSKLNHLQRELCNPGSILRQTYLENYECLESNSDHYARCHNKSQLSQEYIKSIKEYQERLDATCCFYSWFHDCFKNITSDSCSVNATFFVSFTFHTLNNHLVEMVCGNNTATCVEPPLPPDGEATDGGIPDSTFEDIDNSIAGVRSNTVTFHIQPFSVFTLAICFVVLSKYIISK
ncbi:uncharacterized protein LOC118186559 [Stegodyphus dumicola]|uniref:uncharacterized protein LOC118186559 n=1 Tax=Stegodyphus dumicola TaxID=202533 RepID=UPI0015AEACAE|nr:uncharacterized protein LOC118186559 [Stegodyphus dumicola]